MTNKARVGEAFDLLAMGLEPYVARHMARTVRKGEDWADVFAKSAQPPIRDYSTSDPSFLLRVMVDCWRGVFERQLPRSIRNLLFTLRDKRNEWAHNRAIQPHDAQFTLSGIVTLLEAIDAREVDRARVSLDELTRAQWQKEKDRVGDDVPGVNVVAAPTAGLTPWREVIQPHEDVRAGTTNVAEFAADLELVRLGEGKDEYRDPRLFFERTYLTAGLRQLLTLALQRVAGTGGQPVVNCQTNFGGGKTHSLIALYHLFSGVPLASLPPEVQDLVAAAGLSELPPVNRAVVVGNRFAPGEVHPKSGGIIVNTIWGEIAWQLGSADAYALVADSDRNKTNPGDGIRKVLAMAAPCLVLIDEWVAYARELYERGNELPGGSFESQFGFAQALTEAARGTDGALLVVSIPASEGAGAGSAGGAGTGGSDLEVGGVAGRAALASLTNVVTRQAEPWQPAKGDETFEIVRRRLFQPLSDDAVKQRDATAEAFGELYRASRTDFPAECSAMAYVDRIKTAYPIHPEVFDRLYEDWSTVERFQRTRGVLRLMAATISSLWESDDRSPLILPCSLPLADNRVQLELAGKLPDYWAPVIDGDIDGPGSRAADIDRDVPALGTYHATRRTARTIFLGATPTLGSANRGIEVDRVRLGSVFAGERPGFVADALNRLAAQAPHLYVDRDRYWFDRQQNVNRTARDEAARLLAGDRHDVHDEIVQRLRAERGDGDFRRVHVVPSTSADVADDPMARLVVLGPDHPHIAKAEESPALVSAREILDRRGTSPRQYRNMLLFAACDQRLLDGLEQAVAEFLAWSSICDRVDELNLDAHQATQARNRRGASDDAVGLRLADAYKYALVPRMDDPVGAMTFDEVTLDQQGTVAQRASRKLVAQDALRTQFPPVLLRMRLDDPDQLARRWAEGDVTLATLWDDFAKYIYLPRLRDEGVLLATVQAGPASTAWQTEGFGVAVRRDETSGRYLGLVAGSHPGALALSTLVVRPTEALAQLQLELEQQAAAGSGSDEGAGGATTPVGLAGGGTETAVPARPAAAVFRGAVTLDPRRPVKAFGDISKEVLDHLASQVGADVEVRIEIVATKHDGFPDDTVRTVTENARTLKFDDGTGFSEE
jgi:predicted AAA+ superfamily ATPase